MRFTFRTPFKTAVKRNIALNYLFSINKEHTQARGKKKLLTFANDYIGTFIAIDGLFEKIELTCLIGYLRKNHPAIFTKMAIDIGANIGNHSIFFSKYFENVIAYEAHPEIFEILSLNTKKIGNIEAKNIGLSDQAGTLKIETDHLNMGASKIKHELPSHDTEAVHLERGDKLLKDIKNIGLIKIDVEGMEMKVLHGLKKTIDSNKPIVVFEQHIDDFEVGDVETPSITFLRDLGYEMITTTIEQNVGKNWVARRIYNLISLAFGVKTTVEMLAVREVPSGSYSMIVAIHKSNC